MDVEEVIKNVLTHHGIKGMKWGVRKDRSVSSVTVTQKGKKLKAVGGANHPAHSDAIKAKTLGQTKKRSGTHSLSNEELKAYANRLQLEANVNRLEHERKNAGARWVSGFLKNSGKQTAQKVGSDAASRAAGAILKTAVVGA